MRKLASIRKITSLRPIPDADAIECAVIDGWTVVVKKGEFKEGDLCVYFEIDSFLPTEDPRFAFLATQRHRVMDGVSGHPLKTVRLRKQLSQGLALPVEQFPELDTLSEGSDVSEALGIVKWEPPVPADLSGAVEGAFPTSLVRKTDSERAQNLVSAWDELRRYEWVATEKVDGTSITILNDDDVPRVCSRNWEIQRRDANTYWAQALEHVLPNLFPGFFVQGEIYGPGIQGNPLGVSSLRLAVFSYGPILGDPLPRKMWPDWLAPLAVPEYTTFSGSLPETVEDAVEALSGIKSLIAPGRLAEGVVFHTADGSVLEPLGFRPNFKVISNKYLLKNSD